MVLLPFSCLSCRLSSQRCSALGETSFWRLGFFFLPRFFWDVSAMLKCSENNSNRSYYISLIYIAISLSPTPGRTYCLYRKHIIHIVQIRYIWYIWHRVYHAHSLHIVNIRYLWSDIHMIYQISLIYQIHRHWFFLQAPRKHIVIITWK